MKRPFLLLALLAALASPSGEARAADQPWETAVRQALEAQNQELTTARRRGSLQGVVTQYSSRAGRQPTALNHFLLGRVLYFQGDKEGASRHLRQSIAVDPNFWFARLRLAMLELEREDARRAEDYLNEVLRVKPREPDALKLLAQIRMSAEDWDGALRPLEMLLSLDAEDDGVRRSMVLCYVGKEDWATALGQLRVLRGRHPEDLTVRWYYALVLFQMEQFQEATRELEAYLLKTPKPDLRALDMLRVAYARLEDWKGVQSALERMLPHVPEGEVRTQMEEALQALKEGRTPGAGPDLTPEQIDAQQRLKDLIDRAQDPADAEGRREALQDYLNAEIPMLPSDLAHRIVPDVEPDATCRGFILRIMGRLQNAALAHLAAFGLYDPSVDVQVVAAESLGDIGTPSGILYLLPYFLGPKFASTPSELQVRRMNAARAALIRLTGRADGFGSAEAWIPAESIDAMREDWGLWLAGPAGVQQRLEAIRDLGEHGETQPQLYLMEDVQDPQPAIVRAAYQVLRTYAEKSVAEEEEPVAAAMWPRFPRYSDAQLKDADLPAVRQAVLAWWKEWRALRDQSRKEN